MNEEQAREFAEAKCKGKTEPNFAIETNWGWVFRLVGGRRLNEKYPIVFVDAEQRKVAQLRDLEIERKIEIWTRERKILQKKSK